MTLARYVRPLAAALSLVSLLAIPAVSHAQAAATDPLFGKFDALAVFGDSLADTGNVWRTSLLLGITPAPPPSTTPHAAYDGGRFSNGPVAFEYLWQRISGAAPGSPGAMQPYIARPLIPIKGATNFAFGGTGTPALDQTPGGLHAPGLLGQVELFRLALLGRRPSAKTLYVIVTGANDYRVDQYNTPMKVKDVVKNISTAVTRLHGIGARDVLLLTLPDLGKLPYLTPQQAADGTATAVAHNTELAKVATQLRSKHKNMRLRLVDVNVVFDGLRAALSGTAPAPAPPVPLWSLPALDVLLPPLAPDAPMSACLFIDPVLCVDAPAFAKGEYAVLDPTNPQFQLLFWDVVHPTTFAHRQLADYLALQLMQ